MFNRTGFNRTPFNRPFSVEILFSARMDGEGSVSAAANVEYTASIAMHGEGTVSTDFIREIIAGSAVMHGEGTLTAANIRERLFAAFMHGEGTLTTRPRKFHVDSITVTGPFAPGNKVVIDTRKLRVTKNGVSTPYDEDFFDLHPGENTLTYTDTATGRTVQVRVTWRDRYL